MRLSWIKKHLAFRIAIGFFAIGIVSMAMGTIGYFGISKLNSAISATALSLSSLVATTDADQAFRTYVDTVNAQNKTIAHEKILFLKDRIANKKSSAENDSIINDIEKIDSQLDILEESDASKKQALDDIDLSVNLLENSADELLKKAEMSVGIGDAAQKNYLSDYNKTSPLFKGISDLEARLLEIGGFPPSGGGQPSKASAINQKLVELDTGVANLNNNVKLITDNGLESKLSGDYARFKISIVEIKSALNAENTTVVSSPGDRQLAVESSLYRSLTSLIGMKATLTQRSADATDRLQKAVQSTQKSRIAVSRGLLFKKSVTAVSAAIKDFQINPTPEARSSVETMLASIAADGGTLIDLGLSDPSRQIASTKEAFEKLVGEIDNTTRIKSESDTLVENVVRKISSMADQIVLFSNYMSAVMIKIMLISVGLALIATILISVLVGRSLTAPITALTNLMRKLASGDTRTLPIYTNRADEIGEMARTLDVFRENIFEKQRIESESEEQSVAAQRDRARNDDEKRVNAKQLEVAIRALGEGLGRLSLGNLTAEIDVTFSGDLDQLRLDFNNSVVQLNSALTMIKHNALAMQVNGNAIWGSAEELSKRTEIQAVSLEETAAAVEEITTTVRATAGRAKDALNIAIEAKNGTDDSTSVVEDAIGAMARIESASKKIEHIVDVIENIAFQTNLLALNAGIEAARAGEAGKGFAVVAMEVRELAQRSADAAREIKVLIDTSSTEVSSGVLHVRQTGFALGHISSQIARLSDHVQMIALAAEDQSSGLQEVNGSVNRMDQMTQSNATMAQETNALSRELATKADELVELIDKFHIVSEKEVANRKSEFWNRGSNIGEAAGR